jgi:hypothetical protein
VGVAVFNYIVNPKALKTLKEIVLRDCGVLLADPQAQEFGMSLLKLTRISVATLARAEDKKVEQKKINPNNNGKN